MSKLPPVDKIIKNCLMCPRDCGADRTAGAGGFCRAGRRAEVCAAHLHFGEEPPISGINGSGTIFFNHCNLHCVYCQNFHLSQIDHGREFETDALADLMLSLQNKNAHNINLVTPTHYAVQIAHAILKAREKGLTVPIVYNTGGYEKIETLKMLKGLIQVYLVDMRYGRNEPALKYSSCGDYVEVNQKAVKEMHGQVGYLKMTQGGIAEKGVLIRHLVLPEGISGTEDVFRFIAGSIGKKTYISFMSQYYPAYNAVDYKEISRGINRKEYEEALHLLHKYGLKNGWVQQYMGGSVDPDFAGTNIEPDV